VTVTCTGVIVGYCATGSSIIETAPASEMMIATTAAKIGRSMKNRENMGEGLRQACYPRTTMSTRRA
jgi:hypothetical protein